MKKIVLCLFLFNILMNLSSCWSSHDIEKLDVILSAGVDRGKRILYF
ncbi:hypothetical protein [Evansella halocellulosilytica]|nr:hypothetical protein [Evansella halocellulosilytica]